jgi:hypothetical protein
MLEVLTCVEKSSIVWYEVCKQQHVVSTKQSERFVANLLKVEDITLVRSISISVNQYAGRTYNVNLTLE